MPSIRAGTKSRKGQCLPTAQHCYRPRSITAITSVHTPLSRLQTQAEIRPCPRSLRRARLVDSRVRYPDDGGSHAQLSDVVSPACVLKPSPKLGRRLECLGSPQACPAFLVSSSFSRSFDIVTDRQRLASIDLDECIERLYKKELLAASVIEAICAKTKELLMKESNVLQVPAPVTVVGDIHGQFFDLIEIFHIGGWCPNTNYLFLGRSHDH